MTIVEAARGVTSGVETHRDVHVAEALDPLGGLLGSESFPPMSPAIRRCSNGSSPSGRSPKIGIEGTGSYGAGLSRYLRRAGVEVTEVDRPNRKERRRSGKSDPLDAVEAARAALGGRATGSPKSRDGANRRAGIARPPPRSSGVKVLHDGNGRNWRCRLDGARVDT